APDWDGVLEAFQFGPIAMQATPGINKDNIYDFEWHVDPHVPMGEDCLHLNVWTPATSPDDRLPVIVWLSGGGLQVGYPSEMEFDGERIARRGVVVVTINYRLNVFGFLCHPEITKRRRRHRPTSATWTSSLPSAGFRKTSRPLAEIPPTSLSAG